MSNRPRKSIALLLISLAATTSACYGDDASPQAGSTFTIPLTNRTTATAFFLPARNAGYYLVYTTATGKSGFWLLTTTTPTPQPTPVNPPVPIVPPPQPPAQIARIITITDRTPAALPPQTATAAAARGIKYDAFTVAMVATPGPSPDALAWIGRSAGHAYPYTFTVNATGTTIAAGATPATDAAFLAAITQPKAATAAPPPPPTQQPPCTYCESCKPQTPFWNRGRR